jgi:hypothetical protein
MKYLINSLLWIEHPIGTPLFEYRPLKKKDRLSGLFFDWQKNLPD